MKRESVGGQRLAQCTWHAVVTPRRRHCISLANGAAGPGVLRAPAVVPVGDRALRSGFQTRCLRGPWGGLRACV